MNKKRIYTILSILFLISIIASSTLYYKYMSTPKNTIVKVYLFSTTENAEYHYTVYLKPNTIYNVTSLSNEDYIYTRLIQNISLTFNYDAAFDKNGSVALTYYSSINLISPDKWSKTLNRTDKNTIQLNGSKGDITLAFDISPDKYLSIAKKIADETGTSLGDIIIEVTPHIELQFTPDDNIKGLNDVMEPKLQIKLMKNSEKGSVTYFKGFQYNKNIPLYDEKIIANEIPATNIYASLGILILSVIGLLSTDYFYTKSYGIPKIRRGKRDIQKYVRKVIKENDDIIIETQVDPDKEYRMYSLVRLPNISDLIKVSEILSKPILYFRDSGKQHVFYLLDEKQRYQYEVFSEGENIEEEK